MDERGSSITTLRSLSASSRNEAGGVGVAKGPGYAAALDVVPQAQQLGRVLGPAVRHRRSPVRLADDEPFLLQEKQRLAHRALADGEALRELHLEDRRPRRQQAEHDLALERGVDRLAATRSARRGRLVLGRRDEGLDGHGCSAYQYR